MVLGDALRNLADLVDGIDETDAEVIEARPDTVDDDGDCIADLRVRIPADGDAALPEPENESDDTEPAIVPDTDDADGGGDDRRTETPDPSNREREDGAGEGADADTDADVGVDGDTDTHAAVDSGADEGPDPKSGAADGDGSGASPDDAFACTYDGCEAAFDSEHGMRIHRSKAHGPAGPDYDPEELQAAYDRHDSFGDMRDALGVDVSAQTVRRWMLDRGIHSPETRSTSADETADDSDDGPPDETGEVSADGSDEDRPAETPAAGPEAKSTHEESDDEPAPGTDSTEAFPAVDDSLPEEVTAANLREAVEGASTLYDVQTELDLDRETARDLLSEYDLLELVHGRVADRRRREELKDEIDDRLEANALAANSSSD